MKTLDQRILELLKKYMEKLKHKKVLTSREEVEANTNETNLVAAPVVAELYNKLAGFEPVLDATGKMIGYKTDIGGADTVFPFFKSFDITLPTRGINNVGGIYLPLEILESVVLKNPPQEFAGSANAYSYIYAKYASSSETNAKIGAHGKNGQNIYGHIGENILDVLGAYGDNKYLLITASDANIESAVNFTLAITIK